MKKRILIICPYPENEVPGQRLKYEQYFEIFRQNGYQISVSPFFTKPYYKVLYVNGNYIQKITGTIIGYIKRIFQLFILPFYDGIYIFLYVVPLGGSSLEIMYKLFSRRIIYDIDDLVYLGKTSKQNSMIASFRSAKKYFYLMKVANHVITCTPYLDSIAKKYNSKTTDISSTINTQTYIPIQNYKNDRKLVLGWSGSHSTAQYLKLLVPVLIKLREKADFKLLVIGASTFNIEGIEVEVIPWSSSTEVQDLQRIDIGLYPLPNEDWVLGKSGLKALQYMALGIPTVATAIGANFRIIETGESGFLVSTHEEWLEKLHNLLFEPELRKRIGQCGRIRVEKKYSIKANEELYLKIFHDVFN